MATSTVRRPSPSRDKLVAAGIALVRRQGYAGTSVDDLCAAAGVTKGSFFHHFRGKDELGAAAARVWGADANAMFASRLARFTDPVARVMAYIDLRIALLEGEAAEYMCYAGTVVQEVWQTHPALARAASGVISGHIDWLEPQVAAALGPGREALAGEVSALIQANVQGALILAKADGDPVRARACLGHLRRYVANVLNEEHR